MPKNYGFSEKEKQLGGGAERQKKKPQRVDRIGLLFIDEQACQPYKSATQQAMLEALQPGSLNYSVNRREAKKATRWQRNTYPIRLIFFWVSCVQ
jgi:hypothetical protein